jgi:Tripartite tricarboxylate transporter TctB family
LSRKQADLIFSLVLLVVIGWMVWEAGKWDLRARLFPIAVGVPAIGLALLQLGFLVKPSFRRARPKTPEQETPDAAAPPPGSTGVVVAEAIERAFGPASPGETEAAIPPEVARARSLHMVGWILAITLGIVLVGFELGAGVLTFLFLRFASHERLRTSVVLALATYLSFYVIFDRALVIPFPPGAIADAFSLDKPLDHYVLDPIADRIQNR